MYFSPMILARRAMLPGLLLLAACADTNAPLPDPVEVLLAVNRSASSLSIVPVDAPAEAREVALGGSGSAPSSLAARNALAVVPLGTGDAVAVVDLRAGAVLSRIPLPANSGARGAAIVDDSIAYVGNPNLNTVSRVNYQTGETSEVAVGQSPQALAFTRGRVFVLNGNLNEESEPRGESWITVVDPATNARATGVDSIPLTGPGNARSAALGGDGLLYVVVSGSALSGEGRLSIVDPVERVELASFSGLGPAPGQIAGDGEARLFVSSPTRGLLPFDTDSNVVVQGSAGSIAVPGSAAVAVDSRRRVYAVESGNCGGGAAGRAVVLSGDLAEELGTLPLGRCPVAALTVHIPPE
jgi:hypothetical protein